MKKNVMKNLRKLVVIACAALVTVGIVPSTKVTAIKAEEETTYTASNPYYGGWSNCTWSAWQLVYEATGVALPRLGNAGEWYANAMAYGYTVSTTPRANSVGVWSGHVVYVTAVDGSNIYIKEGGFLGGYNECWIDGYSARYGEALIGYIYIPSDMNEVSAPTYSEQIASNSYVATTTTEPGVEMAIAEEVQDQDIENLEEDVIKKYDPELVEKKKAEEEQAMKDMQAEEEQLTSSSSTTTPSTSSSNTANLTTSILTPLIKKK